jgi:hypothetical protein
VSVPLTSLIPCANRPSSFATTFSQIDLRSGRFSSFLYSSCCHMVMSVTAYVLLILGGALLRVGMRVPLGLLAVVRVLVDYAAIRIYRRLS